MAIREKIEKIWGYAWWVVLLPVGILIALVLFLNDYLEDCASEIVAKYYKSRIKLRAIRYFAKMSALLIMTSYLIQIYVGLWPGYESVRDALWWCLLIIVWPMSVTWLFYLALHTHGHLVELED